MRLQDSMKLAAAVVGTAVTGRPPIQVSRKVLPIRANYPRAEGLMFTSRFIYDGAGRRIEELCILSGRIPPGGTCFYFAGQLEVEQDGRKIMLPIPNRFMLEPVPIMARTKLEAFKEYDNVLKALAAELQKKLDEAEAAALKEAEEAAKAEALKKAPLQKEAAQGVKASDEQSQPDKEG